MASNSSDEETFANFHRMQRPIKNLLAPSPADHGHDGVFAKRQPPVKIAAVTSETAKSPALKKMAANFPQLKKAKVSTSRGRLYPRCHHSR